MRQIIPAQQQFMPNNRMIGSLGGSRSPGSDLSPLYPEIKEPNSSITSSKQNENAALSGIVQQNQQVKPPRSIKMMIKVVNKQKLLEVRFDYDLDKDTPEGVVNEMKNELGLSEDIQIGILKLQIQKIVERFFNMPQVDITHATAMVPGASNASQANSGGALMSRTQRIESLASQEANLRQQEMQSDIPKDDSHRQLTNAAFNLKLTSTTTYEDPPQLHHEDCQQNDLQDEADQYVKEDGDNDAPEEEAIIIDERGGAQEHHNQTMDEAYHHQNTKDEEVKKGQMIQCNVFNNPVNFVNSMILHDKNDLNDPQGLDFGNGQKEASMKVDLSDKQRWKEEMEITLKAKKNEHQPQPLVHIPSPGLNLIEGELDESSEIMYEQFIKEESTANILKEAFPGYSENYWHEHSFRNHHQQISKTNSANVIHTNMNDTLDLSHCSHSCPFMHQSRSISVDHNITAGKETQLALTPQQHQHHSHYPFKRENYVLNPPPFIADDISIIAHHPGIIRASSHEETKNDNTHNHDQNLDCCYFFTEGMSSSLNINFNVTMHQQNNVPQVILNNIPQQNHHPPSVFSGAPTTTNIQTAIGTSGITGHGLPTVVPNLGTVPSAPTQNAQAAVSHIAGISQQRIHLNVSSNNDSIARMKCKNSIREVLGLLKGGNKDNNKKSKADDALIGQEMLEFNRRASDDQQRVQALGQQVSDTFNAQPGSNFLQQEIITIQNDPSNLEGVSHTPIFSIQSDTFQLNHLVLQGSSSRVSQTFKITENKDQQESNQRSSQIYPMIESPQLMILGQGDNYNTPEDEKQGTPESQNIQEQNHNYNRLYVFQSDDKDKTLQIHDYQLPIVQKNKSSIIPNDRINLTMIKTSSQGLMGKQQSFKGFESIKRFDTTELPPLDIKFKQSDSLDEKQNKKMHLKKILTGLHKSSHEVEGKYNLSFEEVKDSTQNKKTARMEEDKELKPAIPLSADGNGYFHFDNQYSHQNHMNSQQIEGVTTFCQHNLIFKQATMKSEKLQRKNKQMYKSDILTLQKALKKIFGSDINCGEEGHYCPETCDYVKKFQEMYNYTLVDGIVDRPLYKVIMCEALRISCAEPHDSQLNFSDENYNSSVPGVNQLPSSSTSTFDQQSLTSNTSPMHLPYLDSFQQPLTPAGGFSGINYSGEFANMMNDKDTPMPIIGQNDNFENATMPQENGDIEQIQLRNEEIRIPLDQNQISTSKSPKAGHQIHK